MYNSFAAVKSTAVRDSEASVEPLSVKVKKLKKANEDHDVKIEKAHQSDLKRMKQ